MEEIIEEKEMKLFFKTGIIVLSIIAVFFSSIKYIPQVVTVTGQSNEKKMPIHKVERNEKVISLTFDVDRNDKNLDQVLELLNKYKVKASFFVTGTWVDDNPDELKKILFHGHDIGNHGDNHKHMDLLSKEDCEKEIINLHNKVKEITGIDMKLFRPPYGDYNNTVIYTAKNLGYQSIKWSIDSEDWKNYSKEDIVNKCRQKDTLDKGSIILFHTGTKFTLEALEEVILFFGEENYALVPVSKLIYLEDFTVDISGVQQRKQSVIYWDW